MNVLIFNGALERRNNATSHKLAQYFKDSFEDKGADASIFNLSESGIPLFDITLNHVPLSVQAMAQIFRNADIHIWLTPLYHGSMTGVMKNCLDWLEVSAKELRPYLTDKLVGLVCWADGGQAMQGINAMDSVAKSLRAWVLPYSIPIVRGVLFDKETGNISLDYQKKFNQMTQLLTGSKMLQS
jgi:arsenic resistance protein ArsH